MTCTRATSTAPIRSPRARATSFGARGSGERRRDLHDNVRMTVRVGVIGAGVMGADHVNTLRRYVRGAAVGMVADVELARAEAIADEVPGARASADACGLIGDSEVDAVVIASHDSTHAELAAAAIEAGK